VANKKRRGEAMKNFTFHNPVTVYFGTGQVDKLPELIAPYGSNVLLVYGKSSIKRMGLYDRVIALLENADMTVTELSGIDPNPRIESVNEGVRICREQKIDFILAVGGGSVIDASKAIASAVYHEGDAWELFQDRIQPEQSIPLGTILTLSATGTEMNPFSVVSNMNTKEKFGWGSDHSYPQFSILDPTNTFSVNTHQTGCGIVDSLTHIYEFYFSTDKAYLNDRICEGMMKTIIHYGPIALQEPTNYEARSNLMFGSTLALNGLSGFAKTWDGFNHTTEHVLSAYYDIAHADGLAILAPHWMQYILHESNVDKFYEFATNVWGVTPGEDKMAVAKEGIKRVFAFYESLGMPTKLHHVGIDESVLDEMAAQAVKRGQGRIGNFVSLEESDIRNILELAK
jgi:alcohol dehydrogenase YqhD (iron-dependent ADH family)